LLRVDFSEVAKFLTLRVMIVRERNACSESEKTSYSVINVNNWTV